MRQRFYFRAVACTAVLIFLLFYLQLLTGLVNLKGEEASKLTLRLLSSEVAYSFRVTYAPILLMLLFLGHGVFGLQVWVRRRRWINEEGVVGGGHQLGRGSSGPTACCVILHVRGRRCGKRCR